jgi:transcriptional regulator with XRE-family HTH domain
MTQEPRQSKRLTMVQLAQETGVSTTTVSKVLNQLPGVGAQTRAHPEVNRAKRFEYVSHMGMLSSGDWLLKRLKCPKRTAFLPYLPSCTATVTAAASRKS